jgi:hypothetical protein
MIHIYIYHIWNYLLYSLCPSSHVKYNKIYVNSQTTCEESLDPIFSPEALYLSWRLEPILSSKRGAFLALNTDMNEKAYKLYDQNITHILQVVSNLTIMEVSVTKSQRTSKQFLPKKVQTLESERFRAGCHFSKCSHQFATYIWPTRFIHNGVNSSL